MSEARILFWQWHVHTNTSEGIGRYPQLFTNMVYLCWKRYTCMWHAIHIWWQVLSKISPLTLKWQSIFFKAISICSKCLIKKVIRELFLSPILHKNLIVIPCLFSVDFQVVLISTCIEKLKIFKIHFKIAEILSSF